MISYHNIALSRKFLERNLDSSILDMIVGPGSTVDNIMEELMVSNPNRYSIVEDGVIKGNISFVYSLFDNGFGNSWEVGFWTLPQYRNQGLIKRAWRDLSYPYGTNFTAACWQRNHPSISLLGQLGFDEVDRYRGVIYFEKNV